MPQSMYEPDAQPQEPKKDVMSVFMPQDHSKLTYCTCGVLKKGSSLHYKSDGTTWCSYCQNKGNLK